MNKYIFLLLLSSFTSILYSVDRTKLINKLEEIEEEFNQYFEVAEGLANANLKKELRVAQRALVKQPSHKHIVNVSLAKRNINELEFARQYMHILDAQYTKVQKVLEKHN
jgi:hypothetical protein